MNNVNHYHQVPSSKIRKKMTITFAEIIDSVSAMVGVNPGYENFAIQDPADASINRFDLSIFKQKYFRVLFFTHEIDVVQLEGSQLELFLLLIHQHS